MTNIRSFVSAAYTHFNSHAHVERDLFTKQMSHNRIYFNSHAHVERDDVVRWLSGAKGISTHTLTWSVTLLSLR